MADSTAAQTAESERWVGVGVACMSGWAVGMYAFAHGCISSNGAFTRPARPTTAAHHHPPSPCTHANPP